MLPPYLFIDDLMKSLDKPYYVGLLSAAALLFPFLSYKITFLFSQMRHLCCANLRHVSALSRHSLPVLIPSKIGNDLVTELCPNLWLYPVLKNGTGRKEKACKMLLLQAF
jgi:hypothetical protein